MDIHACIKHLRRLGYVVEQDRRAHRRKRHWLVFDPPDLPCKNDGWPDFYSDTNLMRWVTEDV